MRHRTSFRRTVYTGPTALLAVIPLATQAKDVQVAVAYIDVLKSPEAVKIIKSYGYEVR
jgi:ABC-type molybdate transport system substrate-binding protein